MLNTVLAKMMSKDAGQRSSATIADWAVTSRQLGGSARAAASLIACFL